MAGMTEEFNPNGYVNFQFMRSLELERYRQGDMRAQPPATPLDPPRLPWYDRPTPRPPYAGQGK